MNNKIGVSITIFITLMIIGIPIAIQKKVIQCKLRVDTVNSSFICFEESLIKSYIKEHCLVKTKQYEKVINTKCSEIFSAMPKEIESTCVIVNECIK